MNHFKFNYTQNREYQRNNYSATRYQRNNYSVTRYQRNNYSATRYQRVSTHVLCINTHTCVNTHACDTRACDTRACEREATKDVEETFMHKKHVAELALNKYACAVFYVKTIKTALVMQTIASKDMRTFAHTCMHTSI